MHNIPYHKQTFLEFVSHVIIFFFIFYLNVLYSDLFVYPCVDGGKMLRALNVMIAFTRVALSVMFSEVS